MRKPDELALFAALRPFRVLPAREAGARLGIPEKRVYRILCKWEDRGWTEVGGFPMAPWWTDTAPETLAP